VWVACGNQLHWRRDIKNLRARRCEKGKPWERTHRWQAVTIDSGKFSPSPGESLKPLDDAGIRTLGRANQSLYCVSSYHHASGTTVVVGQLPTRCVRAPVGQCARRLCEPQRRELTCFHCRRRSPHVVCERPLVSVCCQLSDCSLINSDLTGCFHCRRRSSHVVCERRVRAEQ
jgi:hypothetical protein